MGDDDIIAEAYRRVRLRYTPDEFGSLTLECVFQEVRLEAERLRGAFQPTMSDRQAAITTLIRSGTRPPIRG
jgi:hypothetical protein